MLASCSRPLDDARLSAAIDELDSAAAEAQLLASLPAPPAYARTQRHLLARSVAKTRETLVRGALHRAREPLCERAEQLAIALELAIRAGDDPGDLRGALAGLAHDARSPQEAQ